MRHSSGFQNNDTIKSQQGSATFFGGSWFATSAFQLRPGKGYLLNVADSGDLTFIDGELEGSSSARPRVATRMEEMGDSPDWVSPSGFQDSMLVHAVVEIDGERLNTEGSKLAGFESGEIRGVSDIFAGPAGSQFQLNLFSNSDSSDNMIPKVFIPGVGVIDLSPKLEFNSDKLHGSIASPIIFKGTMRGYPYESWAQENLIDVTENLRAPWQDADNDGLINHVEFALGMDPLIPDPSAVLRISQESEAVFLEYTRPVGGVEGVAYRMEGSSDLVNWTPLEIRKIEPGEANKEKVVYSVVAQSTGFYRLTIR
jgi:hypothetical protein